MKATLSDLSRQGVLAPLDEHLARALGRLLPGAPEEVLVAAALACRAVRDGHVCVDLRDLRLTPPPAEDGVPPSPALDLPPVDAWLALLEGSPLVAMDGDDPAPRPLVLSGTRLYLYRYHRYERRLAAALLERAASPPPVEARALSTSLERLFGTERGEGGKQRLAAAVAALRRLTVISGGPGTGKTYTVVKLLAVLFEDARARGEPFPRVLLLAPTGKAAQRLGESIQGSLPGLPVDADVLAAIPTHASTIHRALGTVPAEPTRFRHDAENPLPADLVVVDEASMIDVALMAKLVAAVHRSARLVLVGDKDQLASVEAGAILGDIYGDPDEGFSPEFAEELREIAGEADVPSGGETGSGVRDCRVHLTVSHRYDPTSGIAAVARSVNAGDAESALSALRVHADVALRPLSGPEALPEALGGMILEAFRTFPGASPEERFAILEGFRILCAHRRGPLGVASVDAFVERFLFEEGVLGRGGRGGDDAGEWYDGRPILVTANDYQLELWNGDVGVLSRGARGAIEAFFPAGGGVRSVAPARLPPHETVFAMTVHKSQGSEFDRLALLLPQKESPLLTRELLYTAVTRARTRADIFGSEAVLRAGIETRVARSSGLAAALRRPRTGEQVHAPPSTSRAVARPRGE